ncbi:MAG: hypothetical protein ABI605_17770 [Rhizobacter sp.]
MIYFEAAQNGRAMSFSSIDEVETWVAANGGDAEKLRIALATNVFGSNVTTFHMANAWLMAHDNAVRIASAKAQQELDERLVKASENSAKAAVDSAWSARLAGLCSLLALVVAFAALLKDCAATGC